MFLVTEIVGADGDRSVSVHEGASGEYMFGGSDVAYESDAGTLCLEALAALLRHGIIEAIEVTNRQKWYFGPGSAREFAAKYID